VFRKDQSSIKKKIIATKFQNGGQKSKWRQVSDWNDTYQANFIKIIFLLPNGQFSKDFKKNPRFVRPTSVYKKP
jgi:hypothetical protein